MAATPLAGAVCAPPVVEALTTKKVLTTEWILGTRLELSSAADVTKLCSVAMNTYLTMLLETGVIHADPHPGNLLRMPDGRLCILDWGLVTRLDKENQITMIEHVANLVSRKYDDLPQELVKLGFVPEGKEEAIAQSEVVDVLASVYSQWTDGGGATKVDVNRFFNELQGLGGKYGDIFRVPPYFFYIARAFVVLEGIGLSNDPGYSIIAECMPYVSQRLLRDPSPRVAGALATFVYGGQKDSPDRLISVEQVENLTTGFSSYLSAAGSAASAAPSPALDAGKLVEQLADLLLGDGREGALTTPLQNLIVEELSKVLGAGTRNLFASLGIFGRPDAATAGDPRWSAVAPDTADLKALQTAERLVALAEPQVQALLKSFRALPVQDQLRVAQEVLFKLWQYRRGAASTGARVAARLVSQGLKRLSRDLLRSQR